MIVFISLKSFKIKQLLRTGKGSVTDFARIFLKYFQTNQKTILDKKKNKTVNKYTKLLSTKLTAEVLQME